MGLSPKRRKKLYSQIDTDGDGEISVEEFIRFAGAPTTGSDANQPLSNDITKQAFLKKCRDGGLNAKRRKKLYSQIDADGDGEISVEELLQSNIRFAVQYGAYGEGGVPKIDDYVKATKDGWSSIWRKYYTGWIGKITGVKYTVEWLKKADHTESAEGTKSIVRENFKLLNEKAIKGLKKTNGKKLAKPKNGKLTITRDSRRLQSSVGDPAGEDLARSLARRSLQARIDRFIRESERCIKS